MRQRSILWIGSDGKQWVWKQAGEGLIEREVQGKVKFGGGNIMVLDCMGWNGVGILQRLRVGWMLTRMWRFWTITCCLAWQILGLMKMNTFSSKTIVKNAPKCCLNSLQISVTILYSSFYV